MTGTIKIVEPAIYELLKALAGGNVFFMRAPQGSLGPFIIIQRTDSDRWRHINGPSGTAQAYIQIDAYAPGYIQCKTLAAAIESILDGYMGLVYYDSESPQESIEVRGISLQADSDSIDQTDEPVLYRNTNSYLVTYKQKD